jgi:hypothetical protein
MPKRTPKRFRQDGVPPGRGLAGAVISVWLSVALAVTKLLSKMTGAESCRIALTLLSLASVLTAMGFAADLYRHTKEASLKKWLLALIFLLAAAIAVATWLIVVCLRGTSRLLNLVREAAAKASGEPLTPPGLRSPAFA